MFSAGAMFVVKRQSQVKSIVRTCAVPILSAVLSVFYLMMTSRGYYAHSTIVRFIIRFGVIALRMVWVSLGMYVALKLDAGGK